MYRVPKWFQGHQDPAQAKVDQLVEYVKEAIKLASRYELQHIYCPHDPETWHAFQQALDKAQIQLEKVSPNVYVWRFYFGPDAGDNYADQNK